MQLYSVLHLHIHRPPVPTFNVERVDNVMVEELKVLVANPVLNIALSPSEEVVNHRHLVSFHHQLIHQVRANKPCPSGHLQQELTVFFQ